MTLHGSAPSVPDDSSPPPYGVLREHFVLLEGLLNTLAESNQSSQAVTATVTTVLKGVRADVAFWYSRGGGRVSGLAGTAPYSAEQCAQFTRKLLAAIPTDLEVFRWANPDPRDAHHPTAAVVARAGRNGGHVVALSFTPGHRFDLTDEDVARMAVKLLAGLRTHSHTATKNLLNGLIHSLNAVLDAKDPYTAGHSERVARIAVLLGKQMGLSAAIVGDLFLAGLIHDIGKIGIRDDVLLKPGKLTPQEFDEIKAHPVIGEKIVASIEPFLRLCPAVRHHHERYDGGGYPDGLAGEGIPLLARVLGVADALDAMMSPRRYRAARSPVEIDRIYAQESGKQFDPNVVAAFMAVRERIYPPIYQKGIGESAYHAIENIVENQTETAIPLASDPTGR